ncbi:MAG: XTP/dITP diphosphohydrolase [Candidatus Endobugula sp.]|jgi:XTP/dITP diphosphohydrolase
MSINMKTTVVLASNNAGKLREFHNMFADSDWNLVSQSEYCVDDANETGLSFIENAIIKARHACEKTGLPAIADDSGLAIDYLKGAPGIYSARYAGEHGNDTANNQKVISALAGQTQDNRRARFICALAFMQHAEDPTPIVCQASWEGFILEEERGENGFGYDPLFWLPEKNCSSAELPVEIKNTLSHRAKALQLLLAALKHNVPNHSGINNSE